MIHFRFVFYSPCREEMQTFNAVLYCPLAEWRIWHVTVAEELRWPGWGHLRAIPGSAQGDPQDLGRGGILIVLSPHRVLSSLLPSEPWKNQNAAASSGRGSESKREGTPAGTTHPLPPPSPAESQVSFSWSLYWMGEKCFYLDRTRLIFQFGKHSFFFAHLYIRTFQHKDKLKE